jgi:hypothetical protein
VYRLGVAEGVLSPIALHGAASCNMLKVAMLGNIEAYMLECLRSLQRLVSLSIVLRASSAIESTFVEAWKCLWPHSGFPWVSLWASPL